MEEHLKQNNLIYEYQSGFRKSHSTDSCLINLTDHIQTLISKGKYVGMVLLDLQKAFDTVDHDILCKKLEAMGLDFTNWFKSYLGGRQQVVVANDTRSEPGIVNCGVPQGSILGPLLFLCYINDMSLSINDQICKLLLYADDSALIVSGSDPNEIAELLTTELNSCRQWLIDNKLSLHLGKTEAILFGSNKKLRKVNTFEVKCNNVVIDQVKSVKYLGLQLDANLSGTSIVTAILKKANSRLKFLYRFKDMLNFKCRKILCTALIQCHFDYACSSWYPGTSKTLKKKLQIMQNKTTRFILGLDNRTSIRNKELAKTGCLNVSDRVKQLKLGHVHKIKNKTCPKYMTEHFLLLSDINNRPVTRATANDFFPPRVCNNSTNTFYYTGISDWNALPPKVKEIKNYITFKDKLKQTLMDEAKKADEDQFQYN